MARLRTRWNLQDRSRTIEQSASGMGVNIWGIACDALLDLENEGFETTTHSQRLDVIAEFAAFLAHMTDRLVYQDLSDEDRYHFVTSLVLHVADTMQDNRADAHGPGEHRQAFVDLVNDRMSDYSECAFSEQDGPSFTLKRILGDYVRIQMGPKDNKWIPDYVIDAEVPKAMKALKQALRGMIGTPEPRKAPVLDRGGVWGDG